MAPVAPVAGTPAERDADPGHAADRQAIALPVDEILAPERKRARNRMVLCTIVEELLKEWFRR